jgi:hypothetical protein
MASKPVINLTARDSEILAALIKSPLDARQLLLLSSAFEQPFTHERLVRRRLSRLVEAGLVNRYQYATVGAGAVNYYKPTRLGYRMIEGAKAQLPPRSYFAEVSMAMQKHTRALADFTVKTHTSAHQNGIQIGGFYRENELRLKLGDKTMQPDSAFQLLLNDGRTLNYLVEIDCGTEPIRSTKQRESLEQKIRFYDAYRDTIKHRFFVLVLFNKPSVRITHFCQVANSVIRDPQRTLFYAASLPNYLSSGDALTNPVFLDRYNQLRSMHPRQQVLSNPSKRIVNQSVLLANVPSVW